MNSRFSFILFLLMACFMMSSGMIFQAHAIESARHSPPPPPPPPLPTPPIAGKMTLAQQLAQQKDKLGKDKGENAKPDYDLESDYKKKHAYYSYSSSALASAASSAKKKEQEKCALEYTGEKALFLANIRVQNYCQICQVKSSANAKECHRDLKMIKESFANCTQEDEAIVVFLNDFMQNKQVCEFRLIEDITYKNAHTSSGSLMEKLVTRDNVLLLTETLEKSTKFSLELTKGLLDVLVLLQKYNDTNEAQD